jgi:DNA-binding response OmpR family regulator
MVVFDVVVLVAPPEDPAREIASLCGSTTTPVLVLTSAPGEAGVARALDAGAADAVAFPYAPDELLARVRLALRRLRSVSVQRAMRFGELALDLDASAVQLAGQRLDLAPLEYRLLVELMLAGGRVAPRDHLLERLWGAADHGRLNDLRVHVNRLRGKLQRAGAPASTPVIVSVQGLGYRLSLGS